MAWSFLSDEGCLGPGVQEEDRRILEEGVQGSGGSTEPVFLAPSEGVWDGSQMGVMDGENLG